MSLDPVAHASEPACKLSAARRSVRPLVTSAFVVLALYFAWMYHRADLGTVARDKSWPRGFLSPDFIVAPLERAIDRAFPAEPDTLKLHGEFLAVQTVAFACAFMSAVGALVAAYPLLGRGRDSSG